MSFWKSTQVESRLPTLQPRRSLLPGPKSAHCPHRASDVKLPHLSPSTPSVPFRHLVVGLRVETTDGRTGLLHFKGKTHFAQGCMCGIELDDPIGKHDGSVDGIHYFDCPEGYGVFVPAHKVHNLPPPSPSSPTSTLSHNSSTSICSRESKDSKPCSRIPTLGLQGGKLPRPKTLQVSKDSQTVSKLKSNKRHSKNLDCGKSDTSSEKSSTSSKLFQSKKISPVHTSITHSGWTGDNRTKGTSKRTTDSQSNHHKPNHNTTFTVSDSKRQYARVNPTQDKVCRSSGTEQSSKSLLQRKLARNKNVNGKLNSRPSLNDLTRTFEGDTEDNRKDKPDIVEGCYSKLNETFELDKEVSSFFQESCSGSLGWDDSHSLSPLEDSSSGREKSDSSLAWDFEVPQSSTPVQIHLQVSSEIRTSIPEEPRIYPLGIGATAPAFQVDSLSSCDTENTDEEIEYNEFLAIPTFLDTPTGRYKFDLLTPEELEQALNEYNLLPEELQDAVEFEPQFSDVKPRIWEPITTVEDEFLRESSNALFTVPLTAMDPELKEKYEGFETPTVDSEATTPIGIASNGMEVDYCLQEVNSRDIHGNPREYPSVLPTPTSDDYHSVSTESGTVVEITDRLGEHMLSQGALSDANDTTLVDNPSSMDDGVDLSEDFEMEVDPHNTTYDIDLDLVEQEDPEQQNTTFIAKCAEKRQEGDGQEVKIGMLFESNNNSQVSMTPVDLLEGTPHLKTCDPQAAIPDTDKFGTVIVSSGTDVEVLQSNGTTSGCIVTSLAQGKCFPVTVDEKPHEKLGRVMMDTEEDLKFRMDEMAVEANMIDLDENKSVESECSRTESDRAMDRRDLHGKVHGGQPNGELQAVMEVGMCLTSQNGHVVTIGGIKDANHHEKDEEKKDEEKLNGAGKRKSLLLTPKKVSKSITHATHLQVTLSRPKAAATTSNTGRQSNGQNNGEKDNKKTYTPSSWRNEKNGSASTKSSVIPRRKSGDNRQTGRLVDKNHPGRYSADAAHLVQKLQPILDVKESRRAESTSSMEVDPGSITSSSRSMRSEVTASSNTSKVSSKAAQNGKPTKKATLSLRLSSDSRRHERKPSSSSMASDYSQRTESRTSIASRPSSNGSREARNVRRNRSTVGSTPSGRNVTTSKPPTSTSSRGRQTGSGGSGRSTTKSEPKASQDANATSVDAAPTRIKTAIPAAKKTADQPTKKGSSSRKDAHPEAKHGHKSKTTTHSLLSTPPDLVYTSLVNGEASLEIKRLESLCESRFHDLSRAKEQLQQATHGFDAMATIVQYVTHQVDGFSAPQLKAKTAELEQRVSMSAAKISKQELEISRLREELHVETLTHEEEMRSLELLHADEIRNLDESLRSKHSKEIQTMATEHSQELSRITDGHQQEMCDMTASHQSLVRDIEEQHTDHVTQINHSHMDHVEQVIQEKEEEMKIMKGEAEQRIRELQDEAYKWKFQCECQVKRTQELEEALRKDDDAKVQAAISQYKHLPDEVASMKAVLEIKNKDNHDLRIAKMALEKEVEQIPEKDEKIKNLRAKVEDVQALMARKTEYERQLSSEHVHLRETYERESHVNKRLSMENEELMWKLSNSDSLSPIPRFKPSPALSPSLSPSPSPSPTGVHKGFSRSCSTDSHESGVFSPNQPH